MPHLTGHRRGAVAAVGLIAATSLALAGCGSSSGGSGSGSGGGSKSVTLNVYAAASLTESFTTLGKQFEKAHPGTTVKFNFGPSSGLAQSINQGAPADVFASAATKNMDQVNSKVTGRKNFVSNTAELVVPPKNPGKISKLSDLNKPGLKIETCQPQVPCGKVAAKVKQKAGLKFKPASQGTDVKAVLSAVQTGQVDAGIVYTTDAKAAGNKVKGIMIPKNQNSTTEYPIATVKESKNLDMAKKFQAYVDSAAGQKVLTQAGFSKP